MYNSRPVENFFHKSRERTAAPEQYWRLPSPPIVGEKLVMTMMMMIMRERKRREKEEDMLREKSNNPNLKGGELQ